MGLEELRAELELEARAQADALLARAREQARRIVAEAEAEEEERFAREVTIAGEALRREAQREIGRKRHAAREGLLGAREALLERIFREAEARLPALSTSEAYRAALPAELERALSHVAGAAVVECAPSLAPLLEAALGGRAGVKVAPEPSAAPGFRVRAEDGRVEIDATLPTRLARLRPELAVEALARLGGGP